MVNRRKTFNLIVPCILIAIPIFLYFWYISVYGVNVIYADDWLIVLLLDKLYTGSLSLTDIFYQHSEHRLLFPNLIFIFLGNLTQVNMLVNMYFSAFLLLFTFLIIFISWIRFSGLNEQTLWDFLPVSFLLFSFAQYDNILMGFQIMYYMVLLFSVISFACLENVKNSYIFLLLALISGVVASFSALMGLLVWPVGVLYLLFRWKFEKEDRKSWQRKIFTWVFFGLAIGLLYFFNLQKIDSYPSNFYAVVHPINGIKFFFSLLGTMMMPNYHIAIAFGFLLFIIFLYLIWKVLTLRSPPIFYLPLLLVFFSLLFDIITTFGRSGFGAMQSLVSRYTTFNILGLVGIYLLLLAITKVQNKENNSKYFSFVFRLVIVLIFLQIIFSIPIGIVGGENTRAGRIDAIYALLNYKTASDDIIERTIYPEVEQFKEFAPISQKYKLNVFSMTSKYNEFPTNRSCPISYFAKNMSFISSKLNSASCFR